MNRRDFLKLTSLASVPWFINASPKSTQNLSGHLMGLTTLNEAQAEMSMLFKLDLHTQTHQFTPLEDYRFGHSLEALPNKCWLAVPYGDDNVDCLVIDEQGEVLRRIAAPSGMGFGGHAVVLPNSNRAFLHFNYSQRSVPGRGIAALVDTGSGEILGQSETPIMHAHDIIKARSGAIIVADDGVIEVENETVLLQPIQPALHFFDEKLALRKSVSLPINGSVVHICEDGNNRIKGSVEQYVRRTKAGKQLFESILKVDSETYFKQFDPEIYADDIPLPASIVSTDDEGMFRQEALTLDHQEPFDMAYNQVSGSSACVFTDSNTLALKKDSDPRWHYVDTAQFGLRSPFGLASLDGTPMIAVNGFDSGVAIINCESFRLERYFDVPTQGVKHLAYAPKSWVGR